MSPGEVPVDPTCVPPATAPIASSPSGTAAPIQYQTSSSAIAPATVDDASSGKSSGWRFISRPRTAANLGVSGTGGPASRRVS